MDKTQQETDRQITELQKTIAALEARIQRIEKEVALDRPQPPAVLALAQQTRPRPTVSAR